MHKFTLPDMSCGHCVAAITEALKDADPHARVEIDLPTKTAQVDSAQARDSLAHVLAEAGYPPAPAA
ncbi:heavy-metal-associated domain-containing protein [Roseateles cellulosilyticus]|uniref:Heavy-metal-associated domain-containing protein n=1 Tax=Pelomonas cellulosilytica TaxID=2906762 RepID=A0ABS8Y2N6_9BURK|nr:heavy-metal-associated domain-containing protein [Pelomonas sp. P8]MCE4557293.1 heavy-metal-associated domain-containing protein [Pelomonas sp. P8]